MKLKLFFVIALSGLVVYSYGQLKVDSNGKVRVGSTSAPAEALDVNGSIRGDQTGGALKINTDYKYTTIGAINTVFSHFYTDAPMYYFSTGMKVNSGLIGSYDEDLQLRAGDHTIMWLEYDEDGLVGIGDATPSYELDVDGEINCDELFEYSDERLKEDISNLDIQHINNLYNLQAKTYIWNKAITESSEPTIENDTSTVNNNGFREVEKDTTQKIGLIAQQVQEYFPNLVSQDNEGFYSLNYIALIPVLIEAVKDHQGRIVYLEEELDRLKSSNNNLKSTTILPEIQNEDFGTLFQNIPNPFNTNTEIKMDIPENIQTAVLYIFDLNGNLIRSYPIHDRGLTSVTIFGSELNPGMYLYTLTTDGREVDTKRMILTEN